MPKTLMILEVSGKQSYIFGHKALKENSARSACINYVLSDAFFSECTSLYSKEKNFVYSGGGHTVLQFDDETTGVEFAKKVTEKARRDFGGLELFVKQMRYDDSLSPKENLTELSRQLELKKSYRANSIRQTNFGIEEIDTPALLSGMGVLRGQLPQAPAGYRYLSKVEDSVESSGGLSIIHIDGNSMGNRVSKIYDSPEAINWESCVELLDGFSRSIQKDYEDVFRALCEKLSETSTSGELPIRPIILAGDDMCIITLGKIGLYCADWILKELAKKSNPYDFLPYSACAGVAIVHQKVPFHQAYRLSEELCSNAKKYSAQLDENKAVSAIDWHAEWIQTNSNLRALRSEQFTCDGDNLLLRPVTSVVPEGITCDKIRSFAFFESLYKLIQSEKAILSHNKLKDISDALKQGEIEAEFILHDKRLRNTLYSLLNSPDNAPVIEESLDILLDRSGKSFPLKTFYKPMGEDKKRCIYFDTIEMGDRCVFL